MKLNRHQRQGLAWIIEDAEMPYYSAKTKEIVDSLVSLGLLKPYTQDSWGDATPLGRRVWKKERVQWVSEHGIGAAYREGWNE